MVALFLAGVVSENFGYVICHLGEFGGDVEACH